MTVLSGIIARAVNRSAATRAVRFNITKSFDRV